jgi:hypothetical protein
MTLVRHIVMFYAPVAALVLLALFASLFLLAQLWQHKRQPSLRPIAAYERFLRLTLQGLETGRPLHVSVGSGDWTRAAPELIAGLIALDHASQRAALAEQELRATTGSPVALLLAMNLLHKNHTHAGALAGPAPSELSYYGPDPLAYAGGAALEGQRLPVETHLLLGRFGDEGLWLAEALQPSAAPILGGAADPSAAALMQLSVDHPVIGEDLFAAGAYLGRATHLRSLVAQDWMRLLLALVIVGGVILASLSAGA